MKFLNDNLPDFIHICANIGLVGEVYPEIRGIACKFKNRDLVFRYYLDREPTDFDYESIELFFFEFDAVTGYRLDSTELECVHSEESQDKLDPLDGFLYLRREY